MIATGRTARLVVGLGMLIVGLGLHLDGYALLDPDEGRNAEVAREMSQSNDYVLPQLNGLPYLDKPVAYFAVVAAGMEIMGPTVLAARLPSLLFTLATLAVIGWFGNRRFGPGAAWVAIITAGFSPLTIAFARTAIMDSAATLWMVLALVAFYEAIEESTEESPPVYPPARPEWWAVLGWAAIALGILTKGPIALAVPLMVAIPYAVWQKRLRVLVSPVGILLCIAMILPWIRAVSTQVPDFLSYVIRTETFERLMTSGLQRQGPWWYFLAILPAATIPWSFAFLAPPLQHRPGESRRPVDRRELFLFLWIVVPLLFFSLSQSKRPQYILPLVPAFGLLLAHKWSVEARATRSIRFAAAGLALLGVALLVARVELGTWIPMASETAQAAATVAVGLGILCVLCGAVGWFATSRLQVAVLLLALPAASLGLIGMNLMQAIGRERSAIQLAEALREVADQRTEMIAVHVFPLSLPFYLNRTLVLSTDRGDELTSNYLARNLDRWRVGVGSSLRSGGWWQQAMSDCVVPRVFVARADDGPVREALAARLPLIVATPRYVAYGPCGVSNLAFTLHIPPG